MTTKEYQEKSPLRIFLSYFKPHKKLFILDMLCALTISVIDLAFPYISRWCMNELLPYGVFRTFWTVMAVMLVAYALRSVLMYIIAYYGHTFGILVEADIRRDLFRHMQELSCGFYDKNRTGALMSRLTSDLFDLTELAHHGPEDIFISTVTILGSFIVLFSIQWRLALVLALILPVFLFCVIRCRGTMREASAEVRRSSAVINSDIESSLSGIRTAKAFANENEEMRKFDASNDIYRRSKRGFHKSMGQFNATMEFFLPVMGLSVIAVGGALIMDGKMDIVDLVTFNLYLTTFTSPVRKLANFAELFAKGSAGLNRFVELMRTESTLQDAADARELENVKGGVTLQDVDFAYQEGVGVLHNVSLDIRPGESVALVGPSGGGKTTLCQLIPRFYDVTAGSVLVDGQDVRALTQESLRRSIGVVQQDVFLFADTILENIRYGRPGATREEVIAAAKLAEIYDDICAMPEGLDTFVGERGIRLSGGQKQRISIARIFLKDPPILILDEATSALDSVTEARLQEAFDRLSSGRTTIIIAHRLSTVRNADRIAVVENGRIVELGSHAQLMERNGAYAKLVHSQELKS
ncbi:MAG: ABC transporter ATP-binding protein [Ruminococcaceae bacterium]|nr:ABC transporter ATP-binding protein [Oscillospiraceae bacterium]